MAKLLFDMYGVLMRRAGPESHAELEDFLAPPDPSMFWEAYQEFRPLYDAGILSDTRYWNRIRATAGLGEFDITQAVALDTRDLLAADEEMVAYLLSLIGEGHTVGILSNIPTTLAGLVRPAQTWLEECAAVTLSCDIGVSKPDAEAFAVAVDAMGAHPKDTHFFDDRPDFIEGAIDAGLQAHLFTGIDSARAVITAL